MLANLYPALLHRMETTQDRILDAMDRLEIWLDSFTSTSTSGSTVSTVSGKGVGRTRMFDKGDRRQREWARSEVEEVDSSDDSDEEEDGER